MRFRAREGSAVGACLSSMCFSIRTVLIACLTISLFMAMLPCYLELRRLGIRSQNSQDSIRRITILGGIVNQSGMSEIPSTFFLLSSENMFVPESVKKIRVSGILTNAHDLQRLPESVETLCLSMTPSAIPNFPRFQKVRDLEIQLISKAGMGRVNVHDAAQLRSNFTKGLRNLTLSGSGLSDEVVHQFRDCTILETLHVGGEGITGYGFAEWSELESLRYFYVAGRIDNEHLLHFPALPNAKSVTISSELHLSEGLKWLRNCPNTAVLTITGTRVDSDGLQEIGRLKELSSLILCRLKSVDFSPLRGMGSLYSLELDQCETKNRDFSTWPSISVSNLSLRDTDIALASLARIPDLRSVDIDSLLTYQDLIESGLPPSLRQFNADYVEVSNEQLEQLKGRFPKVKFRVPDETENRIDPESRRYMDKLRALLRK